MHHDLCSSLGYSFCMILYLFTLVSGLYHPNALRYGLQCLFGYCHCFAYDRNYNVFWRTIQCLKTNTIGNVDPLVSCCINCFLTSLLCSVMPYKLNTPGSVHFCQNFSHRLLFNGVAWMSGQVSTSLKKKSGQSFCWPYFFNGSQKLSLFCPPVWLKPAVGWSRLWKDPSSFYWSSRVESQWLTATGSLLLKTKNQMIIGIWLVSCRS